MPCVLRQKTTTTEVKMSKIGLFVGSTTGETEEAAETTQEEFGGENDVNLEDFNDYQNLIIGSPTRDIAELQNHWRGFLEENKLLEKIDFKGKKVAYFGTGDQVGYADDFQDAMGI